MVIDNKIVFVAIPKNASWSVEDTCINYGFDLKYPNTLWENSIKSNTKDVNKHIHSRIHTLIDSFGTDLEYVCILRDSTDRFISAWKFFIKSVIHSLDNIDEVKLKKLDNNFIIKFIKENYKLYLTAYSSFENRRELLIRLLNDMEIDCPITDSFLDKTITHIVTLSSQYMWILNDKIKVKCFYLDNLTEFENYMSDKLNVDFKLLHKNDTSNFNDCNVTKTLELINFVETYVDGVYKKTKTLI